MVWIGASPSNFGPINGVGLHDVVALFVHTMDGTLAGTDKAFNDPSYETSAHYGVGLDGTSHQYVGLGQPAWANGLYPGGTWTLGDGNPNCQSVSIETEDDGNPDTEPVTDQQMHAIIAIYNTIIKPHWTGITHLVSHHTVNPAHSCPAGRWLNTGKFQELGANLGLAVVV